jgi:putative ABC transport system permease protein
VWRLTLRTARVHWRRFVLTSSAVVIGVGFVVGSFVLTDSLSTSITSLLEESSTRSDLVVRPEGSGGGRGPRGVFGGPRAGIPLDLAGRVAGVPGVEAAEPVVSGPSQLLERDGSAGAFDFALLSNWPARPEAFGVVLSSGRPPAAAGEVVLDEPTAADRGLTTGSTVRIATSRGVLDGRVVGLASQQAGSLLAAAPVLAVTLEQATELIGVPGYVGFVNVSVEPGADVDEVAAAVAAAAGAGTTVLSSADLLAEAREQVDELLTTFVGLLLGFAAVTLFVSSFLVWNTFTVVLAHRTRELALLRAVGASRRQVLGSVLGEGVVVGVFSSLVGVGVGMLLAVGLRRLLGVLGVDLPDAGLVLAPRTIAAALVVGLGVTLVSVVGPARRATVVPPVAAVAAVDATPTRRTLGRPVVGTVLLVAGLLVASRAGGVPAEEVESRVRWVAAGGLLVFLGVAGVSRFLAGPIAGAIGWPWRRFGGVASRFAAANAVRNPRRTASTASALMIGLALVATTLVVGESVRTAIRDGLARSVDADVVVDSGSIAPFDDGSLEAIAAVPGVLRSAALGIARTDTEGGPGRITMTTGDLDALVELADPEPVEGRLPSAPGELAVATRWAEDKGVAVGDTFELRSGPVRVPVRVVGSYQRRELWDDSIVAPGTLDGLPGVEAVDRLVFVGAAPGTDPERLAEELSAAVATVPNSSARSAAEFVERRTSSVDVILGIVSVLLLFAVAVAALGIANTLALSVVERTRELGLFRVSGMTRRRVRRSVRVEGVIIALFGATSGVVLGVAFGAALVAVLPPETVELGIPWVRLGALVLGGGFIGVLAAALPARRAARLDPLVALAAS